MDVTWQTTLHPNFATRWLPGVLVLALALGWTGCGGTQEGGKPGGSQGDAQAGPGLVYDGGMGFEDSAENATDKTPAPREEVCDNGLDDDQDGLVDEDCECTPGLRQPCYGGAASLAGKGACLMGQQLCQNVGGAMAWGECAGWVAPQTEICGDGVDQDCDGLDAVCQPSCGDGTCDGTETCDSCPADCGACAVEPASCGSSPHGTTESRIRYQAASVPHDQQCQSETQTRTCNDGQWSAWSGTFTESNCVVEAAPVCTEDGVSPELWALPGGPYQNCAGWDYPHIAIQANTESWSGCCGFLVRECIVEGFSTQNRTYCDMDADTWCDGTSSGVNLWDCANTPP